MPRKARFVVPGYPHHVTQRGNRKQTTFFSDDDYLAYLALLHKNLSKSNVDVWAYCLMPNHVHLVAVPRQPDSLAKLLRVTHHRYARRINSRYGWQGHLWQERFHSFVMDEAHLLAAVRYVELNPVRAGLCFDPVEWRWSSVHAHLNGKPDPVVDRTPMCERVSDWQAYLEALDGSPTIDALRLHSNTGWPAGDEAFISSLEDLCGKRLRRLKPGPKPRIRVTVPEFG
jgi:putative transposase